MALKDSWKDKINSESDIDAKDINDIAHAVIDLEDKQQETVKGENGATFIPSVSSNGVISWTNDQNLPNPTPVNIKGQKGDKGERGLQGIQGERGADGEKGDKGDKGDRGEQGIQGIQGVKGEKGDTGEAGRNGTNGKDGKTPVKGTDYFTPADVSKMVQAVVNALPVYDGEVIAE